MFAAFTSAALWAVRVDENSLGSKVWAYLFGFFIVCLIIRRAWRYRVFLAAALGVAVLYTLLVLYMTAPVLLGLVKPARAQNSTRAAPQNGPAQPTRSGTK